MEYLNWHNYGRPLLLDYSYITCQFSEYFNYLVNQMLYKVGKQYLNIPSTNPIFMENMIQLDLSPKFISKLFEIIG